MYSSMCSQYGDQEYITRKKSKAGSSKKPKHPVPSKWVSPPLYTSPAIFRENSSPQGENLTIGKQDVLDFFEIPGKNMPENSRAILDKPGLEQGYYWLYDIWQIDAKARSETRAKMHLEKYFRARGMENRDAWGSVPRCILGLKLW